jgi:clathrin heavy chain
MFRRALENYTEISDIRTCILNTSNIDSNWLVGFLGDLPDP